ncbi:hypothetical protein ACVXHA_18840 [Escherichia coli]
MMQPQLADKIRKRREAVPRTVLNRTVLTRCASPLRRWRLPVVTSTGI